MPKPLLKMSKTQATSGKKKLEVKVVPVPVPRVKLVPIPVSERYNQNARPDPLGRFDVSGEPFPEDRLAFTDAPARAAALKAEALAKQKKKRDDYEAARRAGYKE